jgi:hypothetical protein
MSKLFWHIYIFLVRIENKFNNFISVTIYNNCTLYETPIIKSNCRAVLFI